MSPVSLRKLSIFTALFLRGTNTKQWRITRWEKGCRNYNYAARGRTTSSPPSQLKCVH